MKHNNTALPNQNMCVYVCTVFLNTCIHIEEHFLLVYCRGTHFPAKQKQSISEKQISSRTADWPSKTEQSYCLFQ